MPEDNGYKETMANAIGLLRQLIQHTDKAKEKARTVLIEEERRLRLEMEKALAEHVGLQALNAEAKESVRVTSTALESLFPPGTVVRTGQMVQTYYVVMDYTSGSEWHTVPVIKLDSARRLNLGSYRQQDRLSILQTALEIIWDVDGISDKKTRNKARQAVAAIRLKGW